MKKEFLLIKPTELTDNPFTLIGHDWMLITAGTAESFNTMTASWGQMGVLWNKNVCTVFVRPSRYTYEFIEKNDTFSLSFFTQEWRDALTICGKYSGRDIDKIKKAGLTPFKGANKTVGFEQARLVIECKKLYYNDLIPDNILDRSVEKEYPNGDYHRMYVGEILSVKRK